MSDPVPGNRVEYCAIHGQVMRTEPLTKPDGSQVGALTIAVCDICDDEAAAGLDAFLARVRKGDFDE